MARSVPEWVGATHDTKIPPRVRQRVYDDHDGCCDICGVHMGGKKWEIDHTVALSGGGRHAERNLVPICIPCHKIKTGDDVYKKGKIAAIRAAHTGVKRPTGDLKGRGFDKVAPKEKTPQRPSLPPRSLYAKK